MEKLILQAGGVKTLIGFVHGVAEFYKGNKDEAEHGGSRQVGGSGQVAGHVPDGLPKSQAEVDEEEGAKMPDSPFTRLLRRRGKFPAWFSPIPDHETD